jgi:hypothetical protein
MNGHRKEANDRGRIISSTEGEEMITWVLVEEPTPEVGRAIEIIEHRLGCDPDDVTWICSDVPVIEIEPAQE